MKKDEDKYVLVKEKYVYFFIQMIREFRKHITEEKYAKEFLDKFYKLHKLSVKGTKYDLYK